MGAAEAVGFLGAGECAVVIATNEQRDRAGAECSVARVCERPAGEEGVVGAQFVLVVGGAGGEVEFDEQVERQPQAGEA